MTFFNQIQIRRRTRENETAVSATVSDFPVPPNKLALHNELAQLTIKQSELEFEYETERLSVLRRQNARINKSPPVPNVRSKDKNKLTVVLDLDETLIHSKLNGQKRAVQDMTRRVCEFSNKLDSFQITLSDGELVTVFKRPGLDEFLRTVSQKYELMTYTAGMKQYAEPLLDWLDPEKRIFRHRLYRDSCLFTNGYYVKDLEKVQRDLKRTVLVDNNLCCFLPQLCNGIPISSFYDDHTDDALNVLKGFLERLESVDDVRKTLSSHFKLVESLAETREMLLG